VNRLGTRRIDDRLLSYGLTQTKIFRPTFRDGKPDIHPDLEKEFGLGMSTPREMVKLMALIAEGRAVDAKSSAAMLETLRRQQDRAMIPRYLPGDVQVGNKTGTDSEKLADERGRQGAIRVDAGIVTGKPLRSSPGAGRTARAASRTRACCSARSCHVSSMTPGTSEPRLADCWMLP
jgi:hypothetical protein